MNREPKVGDYLYATCAGEDYGQIIGVGKDANDIPTLDIEVYNPDDMLSYDDEINPLTRLELPPNTKVILRDVQWKHLQGWEAFDEDKSWVTRIECYTPGNNCYRCTKAFSLSDKRTKFA